jgi:hypothetical protein
MQQPLRAVCQPGATVDTGIVLGLVPVLAVAVHAGTNVAHNRAKLARAKSRKFAPPGGVGIGDIHL